MHNCLHRCKFVHYKQPTNCCGLASDDGLVCETKTLLAIDFYHNN